MDTKKFNSNTNPREKANILSVLTWTWTYSLFKKSRSKILGIEDLYDVVSDAKSRVLGDRLEKQWFAELKRAKRKQSQPSLLRAICRTFASDILLLGIIQVIIELILRLGSPMLLGALLQYFKAKSTTTYESAWLYAVGIVSLSAIDVILRNQSSFLSDQLGNNARTSACAVVYRKALRLSKTSLGETAPGKIVNLIANDVDRFFLAAVFMHHMWSAPLLTVITTVLMYMKIGWSAFMGIFVIFSIVPIQGYLGKLSSNYRLEIALKTDERVGLMDEIISGIRVIKMHVWEKPFRALVELARRHELKATAKSLYIRATFMTFSNFTARAALFGTLSTMMIRGQEITADKVFVYMAYFNVISLTMGVHFVRSFTDIAECRVSVRRLQDFLVLEDFGLDDNNNRMTDSHSLLIEKLSDVSREKIFYQDYKSLKAGSNKIINEETTKLINDENTKSTDQTTKPENSIIKLNQVTAKWDSHAANAEPTLDDINLEIGKGKLYIVIGMVGAGKSSLISAILGELKLIEGNTDIKGSISYADQDAWVFDASIRQNIIFGQQFDIERYKKVVEACALQRDFEQLPQGDRTVVGEKGSFLSGGQKARINLARAVYRRADIYLLDDSLSAVDVRVSKHLFERCLQKYLANKTRILATHQLQYIKAADTIVLMNRGKICTFDDYQELLRVHPEYGSIIAKEKESPEEEVWNLNEINKRKNGEAATDEKDDGAKDRTEGYGLYEDISCGTVKRSLLLSYIRSGTSTCGAILVLYLFLATQFTMILNDYFVHIFVKAAESREYYKQLHQLDNLTFRTDDYVKLTNKSTLFFEEEDILPSDYYLYIYTAIVASIFLVGIARSFAFCDVCVRASQRLHDLAFGALVRTTVRFFDTNPSGRILNRFSKDLNRIDEMLPKAMRDATQNILSVAGSVFVACTVNVYFLVPVLAIGAIFFFMKRVYLKTSTNIKRLEAAARAPVFTHLNATLNGIATIRAFKAEDIVQRQFDKLQDTYTSAWYMYTSASAAFGFSLDVFCLVFVSIVTFSFLLIENNFSGSEVGLAITQLMSLTGMLNWGILQSAELTNHLVSVERILEYSELPAEPNFRDKRVTAKRKKKPKKDEPKKVRLIKPPKIWQHKGQIEFQNVSMRYSNSDPIVIKNLNLIIQPTEKVGIVGRTGAGKSSLISAMFRLAEVEGIIKIDGIDTGLIALEDLRKHISIIPQDPVLFSGTLRRNLDPFEESSDELLWRVLEEVELKSFLKLNGNGLDHRVQDRGSNYSTGQRQLICLARAILRNNRILMLDEATANVDPHTDALIQRTIRTRFASCTVLTVAHRLNTIMDSDKVLVMDGGRAVEFDHPYVLLQNPCGLFSTLVRDTGSALYEQLFIVAKNAYLAKCNSA